MHVFFHSLIPIHFFSELKGGLFCFPGKIILVAPQFQFLIKTKYELRFKKKFKSMEKTELH